MRRPKVDRKPAPASPDPRRPCRVNPWPSLVFLAGIVVLSPGPAVAQSYPSGPLEPPIGVSPGSAAEAVAVGSRCPTFSWGVAGTTAESFELAVFRLDDGLDAEPVLLERLPGVARSWTPPLARCLVPEESYGWAVRAIEGVVPGEWSAVRLFAVPAGPSSTEPAEAMALVRLFHSEDNGSAGVVGETTSSSDSRRFAVAGTATPRLQTPLASSSPSLVLKDGGIEFPDTTVQDTAAIAPGVASIIAGSSLGIEPNTTITVLTSRSIIAPTSGFVLAIASGQFRLDHVNGTESQITLGVSDTPTSFPVNQDVIQEIPSAAVTGSYTIPGAVQGLFAVSGGFNTFYFLGQRNSGTGHDIADIQLSLIYLPTSYGSVSPTALAPAGEDYSVYELCNDGLPPGEEKCEIEQ